MTLPVRTQNRKPNAPSESTGSQISRVEGSAGVDNTRRCSGLRKTDPCNVHVALVRT